MHDQIRKYTGKLVCDRSALADAIAFAVQDDEIVTSGEEARARLAEEALSRLSCLGVVAAAPSLPFAELLVRRAPKSSTCIVPSDTETRTFLHDIPFVRREEWEREGASCIATLLAHRKGIIVEGIGIVAAGAVTVEQAYINYSSIFHSTFVKYLQDLLSEGFLLPGEREVMRAFRERLAPITADGLSFRRDFLDDPELILEEMTAVGRYTVERGLVDSFFGNISCRHRDTIYISQTAASLDELGGCIDPVPMDNSSTAGITASSELPAHRRMYELSEAGTILHGHPKFSVVMSMVCDERGDCPVTDCWKECDRVRYIGRTPVVAGEIGAGGLAKRVPPVIRESGRAVVFGHGVFATGKEGFAEPFGAMVDVENFCREEYFRRLELKVGVL